MKPRHKTLIILAVLTVFNLGAGVAFAAISLEPSLVPCEGPGGGLDCNAYQFGVLLNNIIQYFTFTLAVPIATAAIAYGGITMALKPADSAKRTQAKEIIWAAIIGLVLVLAAWLIVRTIIVYLGSSTTQNALPATR